MIKDFSFYYKWSVLWLARKFRVNIYFTLQCSVVKSKERQTDRGGGVLQKIVINCFYYSGLHLLLDQIRNCPFLLLFYSFARFCSTLKVICAFNANGICVYFEFIDVLKYTNQMHYQFSKTNYASLSRLQKFILWGSLIFWRLKKLWTLNSNKSCSQNIIYHWVGIQATYF